MLGFLGVAPIVFVVAMGVEVMIAGPDLHPDGLHGVLAPEVLGFRARPMMLHNLDEKQEP